MSLVQRADTELDMREFCADLGETSSAPILRTKGAGSTIGPGGPRPSELKAMEKFMSGMTTDAIAMEGGIKLATTQFVGHDLMLHYIDIKLNSE